MKFFLQIILLSIFATMSTATVYIFPPTPDDIVAPLPHNWPGVTTYTEDPSWKFSQLIGWFWQSPEWNVREIDGISYTNPDQENTWIWNLSTLRWEYWTVGWGEEQIPDGEGGYIGYTWPNHSNVWSSNSGWTYTKKEIYPWVFVFNSNTWQSLN
jgi:hypothetical protein